MRRKKEKKKKKKKSHLPAVCSAINKNGGQRKKTVYVGIHIESAKLCAKEIKIKINPNSKP
jgi:hypothetical protein